MTKQMHAVLQQAATQELRRTFDTPTPPAWPAPPSTLAALVRHGLLERTERRTRHHHTMWVWTITDAGKHALEPTELFKDERPVYLGQVGYELGDDDHDELREKGYTTNPLRRIDPLPVAGPASTVWRRKATDNTVAAIARKQRARQAADKARYAA